MKIAIVCASGIGDCLIFSTLGMGLALRGWDVTMFSDHGKNFGSWLSPLQFYPQPQTKALFSSCDALFLQHDNSLKSKELEKVSIPLYRFFGSYKKEKHGTFCDGKDYICDVKKTMVENLTLCAKTFFHCSLSGFTPLQGLVHRRFSKRIILHPTASSLTKRLPKDKFLIIRNILKKEGFDPCFVVSPEEQKDWPEALSFPLNDYASFLYESGGFIGNDSGPGHLASLLQIPHLIIGGDGLHMPLWKPGWFPGELVTAPPFFMQFKALRKHWHLFLNPINVANKFINNHLRN